MSSDGASVPGPVRLVSFSSSDPVTSGLVEETIAIALRRSRTESFFAPASIGADSTGDVAIAFRKAPYQAPYNAKPSMKNVNIDDQGPVFWRSARVIAGIAAGREFTPAKSSRGACARFSCAAPLLSRKSKRNSRLGTLYRLTTLFADSDEFNMRCSHKLLAEERYSPRRPARRALPPSSYRSPRSPTWRAHEQTIAFSAPHRRG